MDESLFDSEGINLRYDKGSVGEFLQRGKAGLSVYNAWQLPLLLAFVLVAVAGVMHFFGATVDEWVSIFTGSPFVAVSYVSSLFTLAVVCAIAAVPLFVVSRRSSGSALDRRQQVRTQVVSMMAKTERFPVGMKTQMSALGLHCIFIKGKYAIECKSRYPFVSEDFAQSSKSSQAAAHLLFDAYDYEVLGGRLYVYYDAKTANKLREKRYRKGAKNHG